MPEPMVKVQMEEDAAVSAAGRQARMAGNTSYPKTIFGFFNEPQDPVFYLLRPGLGSVYRRTSAN